MPLPPKTADMLGDGLTYDYAVGVRAVTTTDGYDRGLLSVRHALPRRRRQLHHQRGARH
jgi:hypothetical protein